MSSQTSPSRHSSPRYSTTSRTETRLARHLFTHWGAPRPTLILTTGSPNAETSATTVDSAHRFISTPFAPDTPCVNNQRDRQKIDHDRSFDTNAPRQLPRHLTQYSEQSRKRQVILPNHKQETDHANSVFFVSGPRSLEWRHRSGHLAPSCVQRLYQGHLYNRWACNRWACNRWGIDYTTTGASSSLDQQRFITSDLTRDPNHRVMRAIRHNTP